MNNRETVLFIDRWENQEAIDRHHNTPMMKTIFQLRNKYNLRITVERFMSEDAIPETDMKYLSVEECMQRGCMFFFILCYDIMMEMFWRLSMKYDVLLIDDEKVLADTTSEYFNIFQVSTKAVYSKMEALDFLKENDASVILLDINLSDGSGFELCKYLREQTNIPILFISARNTDDDKIIALSIGGDDYIEKPYSLGVLLAKVKVVLKRFVSVDHRNLYDDGRLKADFNNNQVFVLGKEIKLTSIEYKLLFYMMNHRNRLIPKNELFDKVWNDKFTQDGTLNVHIRKIREQIEEDPNNPKYILTVWKEGYRFIGK